MCQINELRGKKLPHADYKQPIQSIKIPHTKNLRYLCVIVNVKNVEANKIFAISEVRFGHS